MYIFKNAITSITRNKGRNILIGIIVVVISSAAAVTLAIRNSAKSLIESYEKEYEVTATIGINRESMRGEMKFDKNMTSDERENIKGGMREIFREASKITVEDIDKYAESSYVKDYYYQISVGVNSYDIDKVSMSSSEGNNIGGGGRKENFQNISSDDFTLVGYSTISAMQDFISGKYSIIDGEISEDFESKTCVINSELATLNNIEVGDDITFYINNDEDVSITLEVTGIFEEISDNVDAMSMFTTSSNNIITNAKIIDDFTSSNEEVSKSVVPTFILKDKNVIEDFEDELTDKGLSEYLTLSTNLDQVEASTKTISNVSTFATTFLAITLIIGGVVLFVINMINIRERKYEIGVLRTIGMKKSLLCLQFVSELLIISLVSLSIGAGIGAMTSVPVSNYLLENEISNSNEQKNQIGENFGKPSMENFELINGTINVQAFDSIDAAVDLNVLAQLLIIGLILTLISSSAAMISIQKFSPLTILKERS